MGYFFRATNLLLICHAISFHGEKPVLHPFFKKNPLEVVRPIKSPGNEEEQIHSPNATLKLPNLHHLHIGSSAVTKSASRSIVSMETEWHQYSLVSGRTFSRSPEYQPVIFLQAKQGVLNHSQ